MKNVRIPLKLQIWILVILACASVTVLGATLVNHAPAASSSIPRYFGAGSAPICGNQLGLIGYSLSTERGYTGQEKPEFSNLPSSHRQPVVDVSTTLFTK